MYCTAHVKIYIMSKPLIGITAGEIYNREHPWAPVTYGQSCTYIESIIEAGGVPVVFPLTNNPEILEPLCELVDGLLMSGGNDVNPELYGEKPYRKALDPSFLRDNTEKIVFDKYLPTGKPVLAICRGMQFLNVYKGGSLYQDIKKDLPDALNHESSTEAKDIARRAHAISIDPTSKLGKIMQLTSLDTNTHHHQAIKELGEGLIVTSRSEDGVIEAIETDDNQFVIAIQSHPESLGNSIPEWDKLFKAFVMEASK